MVDITLVFGEATMDAWRRQFVEWELTDPVRPEDDGKFLLKLELFFSEELQGLRLDLETVAYWREVYSDEVSRRREVTRLESKLRFVLVFSFLAVFALLKSLLLLGRHFDPSWWSSALLDLLAWLAAWATAFAVRWWFRQRGEHGLMAG